MNKQMIYARLEGELLDYTDYADVPVEPVNEPLVPIRESGVLIVGTIRDDALPVTGNETYVRQGVAERLRYASLALAATEPGLQLDVGYGYRSLTVQKRRFAEQLARLREQYEGEALLSATHRYVAVPDVAGHPTDGAVDIQLARRREPLDFGTRMWDFVPDSYAKSPFVGYEARKSRELLRRIMVGAGFAPFGGEWWHFSYGDKEWAKYTGQPAAFYDQVEFRAPSVTAV